MLGLQQDRHTSRAIGDTCNQPGAEASAPHIGADRVNLMTSPSPNANRNSDKTSQTNRRGYRTVHVRVEAPSGKNSQAALPILSNSLARRKRPGKSLSIRFPGECLTLRPLGSYTLAKGCQKEIVKKITF